MSQSPPLKSSRALHRLLPALAAPLGLAAAWIAYSRFVINHHRDLPPAVPGDRLSLASPSGRLNLYADGPRRGVPLLLIHSINAAGSAYEMRPLYLRYRAFRPVYALDLPGFGCSQRDARIYTPRVMTDAIHAATQSIAARHGSDAIDVMALSLGCEYAARAALENPRAYASLGLLSPTGFETSTRGHGPQGSNRGRPWLKSAVSQPLWSRPLFDLLTTDPSIRFFLRKTWGSRNIDEGLLAYDLLTTHRPGAEHAVWSFLSGYLFADDIEPLYRRLELPVWVGRGTRGDFVDYSRLALVAGKPNWTVERFQTGAMPHFERLDDVIRSYEAFREAAKENGGALAATGPRPTLSQTAAGLTP